MLLRKSSNQKRKKKTFLCYENKNQTTYVSPAISADSGSLTVSGVRTPSFRWYSCARVPSASPLALGRFAWARWTRWTSADRECHEKSDPSCVWLACYCDQPAICVSPESLWWSEFYLQDVKKVGKEERKCEIGKWFSSIEIQPNKFPEKKVVGMCEQCSLNTLFTKRLYEFSFKINLPRFDREDPRLRCV